MIEWLLAVFYYFRNRISGDFFNTIGQFATFNIFHCMAGESLREVIQRLSKAVPQD
jgi:hypothetical protein